MKLVVRITQTASDSFRGCCPALPGCIVYGHSRNETRQRIYEAVGGYLASLDVALPRELSQLAHVDCA